MRLVVDASIILRWCLEDERTPETDALLYRVATGLDEAVVPSHARAECFSGLTRVVLREPHRLSPPMARNQLTLLENLPFQVEEPADLYQRSFQELVGRGLHPVMIYDMVYLTLAELLDLPLWTGDARFYYALRPLPSRVTLIPSTRSRSSP